MRYHKGLGIGHIYSPLKPDDPLLTTGVKNETQPITIPVDDESNPAPSLPEAADWIIEDKSSDFSESDAESSTDSSDNDSKDPTDPEEPGDVNEDGEYDPMDEGSDDSLGSEYRDVYGDRCDSDYED